MSAIKFRDDIQGLRALAIAPVVAFHAGVPFVPGGYVGVDLFFVISGYLITSILLGELREGSYSIAGFYVRRIKRLFPALYLVLAATMIAGLVLLPPDALSQLGKTAIAAIGFVVNFSAAAGTGYFADKAATQPLLHLWSLAVEEQFYLLFPLLLWLAWRYARRALPVLLAGLAAASLAYAVHASSLDPDAAFFSSATRAYELLAGAILAAGAMPRIERRWLRDMLSVAGLAMIVAAVALFDDETRMPGYAALLPVTGGALVIAAGIAGPSLGGRLLSVAPLTALGAISYSLYLWHWPILVYLRWIELGPPPPIVVTAAVALSLALAWLSWRFVEQPVLAARWPRWRVFVAGAAVMLAAAVAVLPVLALHGLPQRFSPAALAMLGAKDDIAPKRERCMAPGNHPLPYADNCTFGAAVPPTTAVWGDSFAAEVAAAAGERAAARGESVMAIVLIGCPPTLGYVPGNRMRCPRSIRPVLADLVADRRIRTVVLALNYRRYPAATQGQLMDGLDRTAAALHAAGKQVVLLDPVPGVPFSAPYALLLTVARGGDPASYSWPRAEYDRDNGAIEARLDALAARVGATRIRPQDVICPATRCTAYRPGVGPLYFDQGHMTLSAARAVLARSSFLPPPPSPAPR